MGATSWRERHPLLACDLAFAITVLVVLVATALLPVIPQPQAYHHFADRRRLVGIPNALDVLSNAGFAVVGLAGLRWARPAAFPDSRARPAWLVTFTAVAVTALGSAYYHLAPDDFRLTWDRLPMSVGFMSIAAILVGERFGALAGRRLLPRLVLAGVASVVWWDHGVRHGGGNLFPYLVVQFGTMAALPLLLLGRRSAAAGPRAPFVAALVLYVVAKVLEDHDRAVFDTLGVSGHTLKHLVAAAAIGVLALEVRRRAAAAA
jgi:hypothetical protein